MSDEQQVPTIQRPQLASDVTKRFSLSEDAAAVLTSDQTPQQFFAELVRRKLYEDALRFAGHFLTPREAVWWGCLCAWQVFRDEPPAAELRTLNQLVLWVQQPTEELRRKAYATAKEAGRSSVAGNLAMAAFYSGGSISVPDQPHVDPPADQPARCVSAAVILASRKVSPQIAAECQQHFLTLAGQVARGEAPWPAGDAIAETANSQKEHEHAC